MKFREIESYDKISSSLLFILMWTISHNGGGILNKNPEKSATWLNRFMWCRKKDSNSSQTITPFSKNIAYFINIHWTPTEEV
jgi:hypothetical protein